MYTSFTCNLRVSESVYMEQLLFVGLGGFGDCFKIPFVFTAVLGNVSLS